MIHCGDNLAVLKTLPECSVHCCVTSPPYYGLRDYGTATWEGGDPDCDHNQSRRGHSGESQARSEGTSRDSLAGLSSCRWCGARRTDSQIGLEPTPEEYVSRIVEVFREVRRVLRNDGTLWLNLGDSYANDGKWGGHTGGKHAKAIHASPIGRNKRYTGLKPKDLIGIPWSVAFALRADGWYLRADIIWHKPNPMPESVTDRCTKAHEYIFLLAKSSRYYFDAEAIEEPAAYAGQGRGGSTNRYEQNAAGMDNKQYDVRNKRSVWTVNPQPYRHAHFATYPPKLIEPCILAGCPVGGVVLDPFLGSGTTAFVAVELGRKFIGIELNPRYAELARNRVAVAQPPLPFGAGVGEGEGEVEEGRTLFDVTTEEESQGGCDEVSA